jgi:ABC-type sulfate transport system permease component
MASASLCTQATDACFEKIVWIVDNAEQQVATATHTRSTRGMAPAFTVTAGILSAWFVRRRRSKKDSVNVA